MIEIREGLKLPAKISEIHNTRAKLKDALWSRRAHSVLKEVCGISEVSKLFRELLGAFPKRCRDSSLFCEALHRTLENYLIGTDASGLDFALRKLPCVLAGNTHAFMTGHPVAPPTSQTEPEPCLSVIRAVTPVDEYCEKYQVSFEMLTGLHSSDTKFLEYFLYDGLLAKLMKTLGVQRKFAPGYERKHPRQLVGCYAYIQPVEEDGRSLLGLIGSTSSLKSRNKKLSEARKPETRYDWCQREECGLCPEGPESCHLSTRACNCASGLCPITNEMGWVNPYNPEEPSLEYQDRMW